MKWTFTWWKQDSAQTLFVFMQCKTEELKRKGKDSAAGKYATTLRQFSHFRNGVDIPLKQLTADALKQFENYLIRKGVVMNTISFYMRILRAVYNKAIAEGLIPPANPFVQVYTGIARTEKRAVGEKVIRDLQGALLKPSLSLARDLFLFSFYTRGMSFVDMAYLRKSDAANGLLRYKRSKTGQPISIGLEPCMTEIIRRYATATQGSDRLLPILFCKARPVNYATAIRTQNQRLETISRQLKLPGKLTTYVARHTWASIARQKGIPLPLISEGMGHTSEQTTRIYLASFDQKKLDQANRKVIMKNQREKDKKGV